MTTSLPSGEAERLDALRQCGVLDTTPEDAYDDIVRFAAHMCGVPIAAISLIDSERQWFKSILGLEVRETSRDIAFCAHTILQSDLMVVPDACEDQRFSDNPLTTGDPSIRFYAGAPLVTSDGYALGSLCVIDRTPRHLTPDQEAGLRLLARLVTSQMEAARRLAYQAQLISEREQAETERMRLAAIVESSLDAIWSADLDGTITSWNGGATRLYGYLSAEVVGRHQSVLAAPDDRSSLAAIIEALQRGEARENLEVRRQRKDGVWIDLSLTFSPIRSAAGTMVGVSACGRDITRQKQSEAALHKEREFQRALLESLQEGIVACDAKGTLTLFNRATREFHGLPEQPLPPEEWAKHFDLYHADGHTPMRTQDIPLFRAVQGETVRGAEMVIAPKSGHVRSLLASGQAIYSGDGKKLGAVVAMHDVTASRQTEREAARLAAIVASSADAIIGVDLSGTITSWNSGAERLYGYAAAEMVGQPQGVLVPPGELGSHADVVQDVVARGRIENLEVIRRRKTGEQIHVSLTLSVIRGRSGEAVGVSAVGRDITTQKRAEAALAESEERLRRLSDAAFEGIAVSEQGIIQDANSAFASLFGYQSTAEMAGLDAERLAAPESRVLVRRKVETCDEEPYEAVLQRRDGSRFEGEVRARRIQREGRPARVTAIRDITERKAMEQDLREREAALRAILESAPIILYAADAKGIITLSEGTGLAALGLSPGEVIGRSIFEFSGGSAELAANTKRALEGEAVSFDARIYGLCLHTELRPMRDTNGGPAGIIGVCFDVTARVLSEERFRVLFEESSDAHLLSGASGIVDCNDATVALLGCRDKAQILSLHPAILSPEFQPDGRRSDEKGPEMERLAREHGSHRFEWTHRRMDGEEFPVEVTLTPVALTDGPVMLAVLHDLSERKRQEQFIKDHAVVLEFQKGELEKANAELEALATTDGLTGLKNHRAFQERLLEEVTRASRYQTPLSVLMLDVDHFKQYNDSYGHPQGDEVLRRVGRLLEKNARVTDLVARYGGEEFVLILPHTDSAGAAVIAERIRQALEAAPWPKRNVTASLGVASWAMHMNGVGDLVALADRALYHAKRSGRNRVTVKSASNPEARAEAVPQARAL